MLDIFGDDRVLTDEVDRGFCNQDVYAEGVPTEYVVRLRAELWSGLGKLLWAPMEF